MLTGRFSESLKQLHKDLEKYQHYCDNICKGDNPINNTYCKKCKQYISKHNTKG